MKLDDFLKCKKVRCVSIGGYSFITVGKEYDVVGVDRDSVFIVNDDESEGFYSYKHFEPVLDSAENPLENMKLTPEFESAETVLVDNSVNTQDNSVNTQDNSVNIQDTPKFKVGDLVYFDLSGRIAVIDKLDGSNDFSINNSGISEGLMKNVCLANQENYEMLCKLYPNIKFEQPHKPLSGDELVRAMLAKGIKNVLCLWGSGDKIIIDRLDYKGSLMSADCRVVGGLTPIDWYTGEPLTESVLDEV